MRRFKSGCSYDPIWVARDAFLNVALGKMEPKEILQRHRQFVSEIASTRKRLRNPINKKTGNKLSESTIRGLESSQVSLLRYIKANNEAIKFLSMCGYFRKKPWKRSEKRQSELTVQQEFILCILKKCVADKELRKIKEERESKRHAHYGVPLRDLVITGKLDRLEEGAMTTCTGKKPKRRSNDIGLEVIKGGKRNEEGPFAKNNRSEPDTAPISEE